jgi:hypothetical protein
MRLCIARAERADPSATADVNHRVCRFLDGHAPARSRHRAMLDTLHAAISVDSSRFIDIARAAGVYRVYPRYRPLLLSYRVRRRHSLNLLDISMKLTNQSSRDC